MWTQLKSVPYSDSFNAEEQYAVVSLPKVGSDLPSNKCAFRISLRMVFHKKIPLFQGKIEKGSLDKGVESFANWTNWALARLKEYRSQPQAPPRQIKLKKNDVVTAADPLLKPLLGPAPDEKIDELRREFQTANQSVEKRLAELSARLEVSEQLRKKQM